MRDPASLRPADLAVVWGLTPVCVFTLSREVEFHHIVGRGQVHGVKLTDPDRKLFSSVFNAIPISRAVHHGPLRDAREVRALFLRLANDRVLEAASYGRYEVTELDRRFLDEIARKWLL